MESARVPLKKLALLREQAQARVPLGDAASVQRSEQDPKLVASCQVASGNPAGRPSVVGSLADIPAAGNLVEDIPGDNPAASAFRAALDTLEDSPSAVAQDSPSAADSPGDILAEGNLVALACLAASDTPVGNPWAGSQLPEVEQNCR